MNLKNKNKWQNYLLLALLRRESVSKIFIGASTNGQATTLPSEEESSTNSEQPSVKNAEEEFEDSLSPMHQYHHEKEQ